ncbi:ATP-binding protein [Streptomyces endophyticus]|uniref:ATP-binding protein n=1 Tax=Streptomyces endophyticus TaxID=714166 RepID=A0ABU6F5C5_9ACTN|nr:ATP-binding protein [Streptomyces endophyticus]MEB8338037.1 ATP-binding protein [Streptomyces endophyticus]
MGTLDSTPVVTAAARCQWQMDYTMIYGSVRLARLHTRRQLSLWGWAGDQYDATVIVSELVTNAISHGRTVGHLLRVQLAILEDDTLRIDVSDPVASFPHISESPQADAGVEDERGRGLHLIRALGGDLSWFLREEGGKTVRAHLAP